jgi:hypothetical protein
LKNDEKYFDPVQVAHNGPALSSGSRSDTELRESRYEAGRWHRVEAAPNGNLAAASLRVQGLEKEKGPEDGTLPTVRWDACCTLTSLKKTLGGS